MTKPDNNKPFPIRLGDLKPILQKEASAHERSLHYWIKNILKKYIEKNKPKKEV
jgi:hypothetical protein